MTTMFCPFCHTKTSITPTSQRVPMGHGEKVVQVRWTTGSGAYWWIGLCNECGKPVMVYKAGEVVFPTPLPSRTSVEIPEDIRNNLIEAKSCHSVKAWRASVVMCRRAMQMAAINKGANHKASLVEQINYLKESLIITGDIHEWATVVRWVGNDGAHPGGGEVDQEDSQSMIDLTEQILHVLYVSPAIAALHRAKLGKQ